MTELKPCPECGSDYLNIMTEHTSGNRVIHCMDCHKYYYELNLTREDSRSDILSKWNEYAQNYNPAPMTEPTNTLPEPHQSGMLKPKPCPFCGSDDVREFTPSAYEIGDGAEVRCQNPLCEAGVHGNTIEIARVKWSRRVSE